MRARSPRAACSISDAATALAAARRSRRLARAHPRRDAGRRPRPAASGASSDGCVPARHAPVGTGERQHERTAARQRQREPAAGPTRRAGDAATRPARRRPRWSAARSAAERQHAAAATDRRGREPAADQGERQVVASGQAEQRRTGRRRLAGARDQRLDRRAAAPAPRPAATRQRRGAGPRRAGPCPSRPAIVTGAAGRCRPPRQGCGLPHTRDAAPRRRSLRGVTTGRRSRAASLPGMEPLPSKSRGLRKRYGSTVALDGMSFTVRPGAGHRLRRPQRRRASPPRCG